MRQTAVPFVVAILVAASAPGGGVGLAQIGYTPSSIEWLTITSDVVVRASVTDLAYKDRAPAVGETRSQWQWVTVTLKLRATLKGRASETIVFVIDQVRGMETLPGWKESGQQILWFLVDIGESEEELPRDFPAQRQGKLRLREHCLGTSAVELGSPKMGKRVPHPVFSMDFQVLDDEDKILEAVKAQVSLPAKRSESRLAIRMPREVAARSGQSGDVNVLYVPVNDRLEELGRAWVRTKEDWLRQAGVQVLSQFKSEATITILKGMLADEAWWGETKSGPGDQVRRKRGYYLREAAYQRLQEWGVLVPRPVLREPLREE